MDFVERIKFLSDKGHELLVNGQYSAAKSFFIDAASIALEEGKNLPMPNQLEYQQVAQSLISMAKNSHNLMFRQIESKKPHIQHLSDEADAKFTQSELMRLGKEPDTYEKNQIDFSRLEFPIARDIETKELVIWKPESLMNGISLITGGSGSGKSETLRSLAAELKYKEIPLVVFDLHGDLDLDLDTISLDYRGNVSINPMQLTSYSEIDGGPIPKINELMMQFDYAIKNKLSSTMKSWLRNLLQFAYEKHGIIQEDPSGWHNEPPTFEYLLELIRFAEDKILASGKKKCIRLLDSITNSTMMAVENRLVSILEHPAFSGRNAVKIEDLAHKPVRILLKPLNTVDMQFLAADTIIRQLYAYQISKGHITEEEAKVSKFRLFIMIDEVKILSGYRGKKDDPYAILNRLATEARKFGIGLILASQIIGHFGRDIKSNAATKLILRTMDLDETKRCAKEFKIKADDLAKLSRPGEGYISTSAVPDARYIQMFPAASHPFTGVEDILQ